MVMEKVQHLCQAGVDMLIGADAGCLMNIGGRIRREGLDMEVLHVAQVLMRGIREGKR
jgi:L-lactate dehydrogenase complex protein LldE